MWELLPAEVQLDPRDEVVKKPRSSSRVTVPRTGRSSGRRPPWRYPSERLGYWQVTSSELLAHCLADGQDDFAWWAFVQRHGVQLRSFLSSELFRFEMASCGFDLDDWEQEVYCRLLNFRRTTAFQGSRAAWSFLHGVVASVVVDGWRYRHRLKRRPMTPFEWSYLGSRRRRQSARKKRHPYRHPPRSHRRKSR